MTGEPRVNIVKDERTDKDATVFGCPAIRYSIVIGFGKDCGLCVREARARLLNKRYLLEMTYDNKNTNEDDKDANRRFSVIGPGIVDSRKEACNVLFSYAQMHARSIKNLVGLEISDLTHEKEGELAGKVSKG